MLTQITSLARHRVSSEENQSFSLQMDLFKELLVLVAQKQRLNNLTVCFTNQPLRHSGNIALCFAVRSVLFF